MRNSILKTKHGLIKFSIKKTVWLYFMILPCLFINWSQLIYTDYILFFSLLGLTVGIGHSIGLHRGIIHKSFKTSKTYRNISIYLFTLTGMGSPISWLKQHYYRDYWQNRQDCPRYFRYQHSIFTDYIWNLHLSFSPKDIERYQIPKDDLQDTWLLWLHKTWYLHNLALMGIVYFIFDINSLFFLVFFRVALVILGHWYIGYASHKYGYSRHKIIGADESGYNDILLGLISFGEGFHNNHHSYPTSAKFSSRWYEVDFSWLIIKFLKKLGIVYEVNTQNNNLKPSAQHLGNTKWKFPWNSL